jgi:hypothetical protein
VGSERFWFGSLSVGMRDASGQQCMPRPGSAAGHRDRHGNGMVSRRCRRPAASPITQASERESGMTTIECVPGAATIRVSLQELYILNNALNEVCNALNVDQFAIRMGVEREEAGALLERIHTLASRLEAAEDASAAAQHPLGE